MVTIGLKLTIMNPELSIHNSNPIINYPYKKQYVTESILQIASCNCAPILISTIYHNQIPYCFNILNYHRRNCFRVHIVGNSRNTRKFIVAR